MKVEEISVNGVGLSATLNDQVLTGELILSTRQTPRFSFTAADTETGTLTAEVADLLDESATITWQDYTFRPNAYTTGGDGDLLTVALEATSDVVRALEEETGGEHWGTTDVAAWARSQLQGKATPLVQPGLGEREIKREEPEDQHAEPESTLDVLAEMAKQTGSWFFHSGEEAVLARPSWLVNRSGARTYEITWDSWTKHTAALTAPPQFRYDREAKEYEGRESLTVRATDPGAGSTNPLSQARPGDVLKATGDALPFEDPTWLIVEVRHPIAVGDVVTITAWRPIDPPEILPDDGGTGSGSSTAGVPTGPLGKMGWRGEQLENAAEIVRTGQSRGLPNLALELAVATAMGESSLRNVRHGDAAGPDSVGLFQQRDTWGSRSDRLTPSKAAGFFYDALKATPYEKTYAEGGASIVFGGHYGPGKSANSASLAIHNVQRNSDPLHYARFWPDAQLVVRECIAAGKDSGGSGGKASGPLGARIDSLMKSYEGRYIDVDGAYGAQCVDLAARYIKDLTGIPMVRGNGVDYYAHPGLTSKFRAISGFGNRQKGDVVAWSASSGAYPNGGYGHVAIYSHTANGTHYFLTQNPGPSRVMPLSAAGILGVMRPKS